MAKPATRQQLIDYCFRKLGAPVLEINVDDDQVDDLVDDAILLFNERHFDGVERMYLKYKVTADDIVRLRTNKSFNAIPEILITAIAEEPGGVACATIISSIL